MNDTISLTMIVKNEAGNLEACLDSVRSQVDEIIIVDTGSTDGTPEIAKRFTPDVFSYPWRDDFSAARNYAISKAKGSWIFSLDADEILLPETGTLKGLISQHEGREAFLLPLENPTTDLSIQYNRYPVLRLFKNKEAYRFSGNIHEQVSVPDAGSVQIVRGPVIRHRAPAVSLRNSKRARNLQLLNKVVARNPHNPFLRYYLGIEWLMLNKPEKSLPFLKTAYDELADDNLLFKAPALRALIICLKSLGKVDEALILCLKADMRYPEFTDIYYLAGTLFVEKREFSLAVKWFRQALECGEPPDIYSHMQGTESYLSHYYLGYCHEMLGKAEIARRHYETALDLNPQYPYPLHSLFLNLRLSGGFIFAYNYFGERDYFNNREFARILAEEFYKAGYPHYAMEIFERHIFRWEGKADAGVREQALFSLGNYAFCTGELNKAQDYFGKIPIRAACSAEAQIKTVLILLLRDDCREARKLALTLWQRVELRAEGYLMLRLIRIWQGEKAGNLPQKICDRDAAGLGAAWFKETLAFLPQSGGRFQYSHLMRSLQTLLIHLSPQSAESLLSLIGKKKREAEEAFNHKFGGIRL